MSIESAIPAGYLRTLLKRVVQSGIDADVFLASEDVTTADLSHSQEISAEVFGRLYKKAMQLLNDETLGLVGADRAVLGTFEMMCLCAIHATSLNDVVQRSSDFLSVARGISIKPVLSMEGQYAVLQFASAERHANKAEAAQALEKALENSRPMGVRTTLYLWLNFYGWFVGRHLSPLSVEFDFDDPGRGQYWHQIFGCPVRFNQSRNAIVLPAEVSAWPNVQNESSLRVFLESVPYRLIAPNYRSRSLSDRVVAMLSNELPRLPSGDQIADKLNMSHSTLRRRLKDEGYGIQELKDEARFRLASQLLENPDALLADVSAAVGFEDVSVFHRAFKRWADCTPNEFRQRKSKQNMVLES